MLLRILAFKSKLMYLSDDAALKICSVPYIVFWDCAVSVK